MFNIEIANKNFSFFTGISLEEVEKNISIETDIISDQLMVMIDADKIERVITNLVNNAIKFSYPKGEIHFINIPQGIALKDFGTGISAENQSQLLHQVVMAGSGTLHEKGNGMGLYLIGQLIKNSEIFISFSSTSEKGTIVSVYSK